MISSIRGMQMLAEEYTASGGKWPVEPSEFATWAVKIKDWRPTSDAAIKLCAEQFSRAMREEYTTDSKGRKVRTKHAVRTKQGFLWDDLRTAPHSHMVRAFQQRRDQIVGDCRQLKNDVDSYNETHPEKPTIQLVLPEDWLEERVDGLDPLRPRRPDLDVSVLFLGVGFSLGARPTTSRPDRQDALTDDVPNDFDVPDLRAAEPEE